VPREYVSEPDDSGQFGMALRWFAPFLGDTEFGFYYVKYHSRLPIISARTGTQGGWANAVAAGTTIAAYSTPGSPTFLDPTGSVMTGAATGGALGATDPLGSAMGVLAVAASTGAEAASKVPAYITNLYSQTASYIVEYPEDIELLGVSFNTNLAATGIALQGEISHRIDMPLQVDDLELLLASLTPLAIISPAVLVNQLAPGGVDLETYIPGYILRDVTQFQATATKVFGPTLGADTLALIGEVAFTRVNDMPSKQSLRLEAAGTYTTGEPFHETAGVHPGKPANPKSAYPDAESWGYRLAGKLEYNNAIGPVTLVPRFSWQHDVSGITPGPGGNFIEGRKAITVGITANYLNAWSADLSYTNYFGADRFNLIIDRDFVAANIKYSF
ncbi:MAG: DUF1302 family protein, partial [Deltaproteobacteria bacterium]|nr:DUF1302 family protein [Deltaproteobacteria bacterium]